MSEEEEERGRQSVGGAAASAPNGKGGRAGGGRNSTLIRSPGRILRCIDFDSDHGSGGWCSKGAPPPLPPLPLLDDGEAEEGAGLPSQRGGGGGWRGYLSARWVIKNSRELILMVPSASRSFFWGRGGFPFAISAELLAAAADTCVSATF